MTNTNGAASGRPRAKPRATSKKQTEANRRNAARSTGPRTAQGKANSAQNAVTHGAYVNTLYAVDNGRFAETPEEIKVRAQAIIDSLEPRDAVEVEQASRVALAYIKLSRLDRYETSSIAGAANIGTEQERWFGEPAYLDILVSTATRMINVLQAEDDLGEFVPFDEADRYHGWESLAFLVRYQGPDPKVGVKDLWTGDLEPPTDEEWRKAFRALCERHWPERSARIRWAEDTRRKLADRRDDALGKADALAANRALEHLEKQIRLRDQALRELSLALATYEALGKRTMSG